MRLSKLSAKEIIDLDYGERIGMVGELDFLIEESTGAIDSMILPASRGFFGLKQGHEEIVIPWFGIRKIGTEMMIVELRQKERRYE